MARSTSERIVIEIDPILKKRLHAALSLDGTSLKAWFIQQTNEYLKEKSFSLPPIPERQEPSPNETGGQHAQ